MTLPVQSAPVQQGINTAAEKKSCRDQTIKFALHTIFSLGVVLAVGAGAALLGFVAAPISTIASITILVIASTVAAIAGIILLARWINSKKAQQPSNLPPPAGTPPTSPPPAHTPPRQATPPGSPTPPRVHTPSPLSTPPASPPLAHTPPRAATPPLWIDGSDEEDEEDVVSPVPQTPPQVHSVSKERTIQDLQNLIENAKNIVSKTSQFPIEHLFETLPEAAVKVIKKTWEEFESTTDQLKKAEAKLEGIFAQAGPVENQAVDTLKLRVSLLRADLEEAPGHFSDRINEIIQTISQ